jgi:hypothetical protein
VELVVNQPFGCSTFPASKGIETGVTLTPDERQEILPLGGADVSRNGVGADSDNENGHVILLLEWPIKIALDKPVLPSGLVV